MFDVVLFSLYILHSKHRLSVEHSPLYVKFRVRVSHTGVTLPFLFGFSQFLQEKSETQSPMKSITLQITNHFIFLLYMAPVTERSFSERVYTNILALYLFISQHRPTNSVRAVTAPITNRELPRENIGWDVDYPKENGDSLVGQEVTIWQNLQNISQQRATFIS